MSAHAATARHGHGHGGMSTKTKKRIGQLFFLMFDAALTVPFLLFLVVVGSFGAEWRMATECVGHGWSSMWSAMTHMNLELCGRVALMNLCTKSAQYLIAIPFGAVAGFIALAVHRQLGVGLFVAIGFGTAVIWWLCCWGLSVLGPLFFVFWIPFVIIGFSVSLVVALFKTMNAWRKEESAHAH